MLRGERLIKNQLLIRDLNERIENIATQLGQAPGAPDQLSVFCECARRSCLEQIQVSHSEYEALRLDPHAFVVAPGHQIPSIEKAIKHSDEHLIVVKIHPETTRLARAQSRHARPA
jgi:hypothetical protein